MKVFFFLNLSLMLVHAMLGPEARARFEEMYGRLNQQWLEQNQNVVTNYDQPSFWGVKENHHFYAKTRYGWAAGITMSPPSWIPFTKSPASKVCNKTKALVATGSSKKAYALIADAIGTKLKRFWGLSAFYATRHGHSLEIACVGYWWAGLYRNGMLVVSTPPTEVETSHGWRLRKLKMADSWVVERNDILVVTNSEFGCKYDDLIAIAVQTAEQDRVPLSQIASNLSYRLKYSEIAGSKSVMMVIRMVESRQVSVL